MEFFWWEQWLSALMSRGHQQPQGLTEGLDQRRPRTPQGQHTRVLMFVQMFTEQLPSVRPMLVPDVWVRYSPDLEMLTGRPSNRIHMEVQLSPWQGLGGVMTAGVLKGGP